MRIHSGEKPYVSKSSPSTSVSISADVNAIKSTDTRRNITLVTPFVLVLLGDADHERAGGNFKYLIVI
jgi:hypothetical protein